MRASNSTKAQQIGRITGVDVREATAEIETSTGTVVQVFSLAHAVPADTWSGSDPGPAEADRESNGGAMPTTECAGDVRKKVGKAMLTVADKNAVDLFV